MPRIKKDPEKLVSDLNIDVSDLYDTYMKNSIAFTCNKFKLNGGKRIVERILNHYNYDLSSRNRSSVSASKKSKNLNLEEMFDDYVHNGYNYLVKKYNMNIGAIKNILVHNGFDLSKRLPYEQLNNVNRFSAPNLVKKHNINLDELYNTYLNNGGLYTAKKFGLSNFSLVVRILEYYNYDLSIRDAKKINYTKTMDTIRERYGVNSALSNPASKEKFLQTNRKKYGSDYFIGTEKFKEQSKKTNLRKYGYEWSTQNPEVKLRHEEANYLKYGVKDKKQAAASPELKIYLNDKDKSVNFLEEKKFTFYELCKYFENDTESQLFAWLTRFDLYQFLVKKRSKPEEDLADYLFKLGFTSTNCRKLLGNRQEIDIYNPDLKIGVEFNGTYYHCNKVIKDKNYHLNKSKLAEKNGIRLIHIYEYEWSDPDKRKKLESLFNIATNNVKTKIYARNCIVREISNKDAKPFNEANHLQGHRNAQVTYGLFYNNNLVQLMSFSRTRYNRNIKDDNTWEIIRGCPGSNNIVVGGVGKLFKHFIREYKPKQIFSYCDFNKFDGKSYEEIGMKFIGYTGPDKKWIVKGKVINRNPHKYQKLKEEAEAIIWGAGSKKYMWENLDYKL